MVAHVETGPAATMNKRLGGIKVRMHLSNVMCAVWLEYWVCEMSMYNSETCDLVAE